MTPTAAVIRSLMLTRIYRVASEDDLQICISQVLAASDIAYEREKNLRAGRIDFYIAQTHLGIEVKVAGTWSAVAHQLHRYASSGECKELLLVTTRQTHLAIGKELYGIPVSIARVRTAL